MSAFDTGFVILGVVLFLSTALMLGMRLRAERLRLKLLKTQEAEQPQRRAVLDAQVAALKDKSAASLLRHMPVASSMPPAESETYWDSLLQFADLQ
jgi:hypothetical protein